MRKIFLFCAAFAVAAWTAGCGYSCGPMGHPQLKTIAVAPVTNETLSYNAAAQMRNLLCETFTTDGSLKLVGLNKADCIVYASVAKMKMTEIDWSDEDNLQANEWRCTVTVKYSVILPGRGKPLISDASVSGSSDFVSGPDLEGSRLNGMRQAMYDAAKKIVANITEAW